MIVSGVSMEPNFYEGDMLVLDKMTYTKNLNRGDVIVAVNELFASGKVIKRIVAVPGDKIRIQNGLVFVNNEPLNEPYLKYGVTTELEKDYYFTPGTTFVVGPDSYVAFGDNRADSLDSRYFGAIHISDIVGKVKIKYFPLNKFRIYY